MQFVDHRFLKRTINRLGLRYFGFFEYILYPGNHEEGFAIKNLLLDDQRLGIGHGLQANFKLLGTESTVTLYNCFLTLCSASDTPRTFGLELNLDF